MNCQLAKQDFVGVCQGCQHEATKEGWDQTCKRAYLVTAKNMDHDKYVCQTHYPFGVLDGQQHVVLDIIAESPVAHNGDCEVAVGHQGIRKIHSAHVWFECGAFLTHPGWQCCLQHQEANMQLCIPCVMETYVCLQSLGLDSLANCQ